VNFTAAVMTVVTMGATISTETALAADILDPITQADTTAGDITVVAVTVVVAMAAAVTAVAEVTTDRR
jgi:hypothetical protein